jgi:myo-inositol-1(or 4)-monophosphatase
MTDPINWLSVRNQVEKWMREAGSMLKEAIKSPINVETKSSPDDLVTDKDRDVEQFLIGKIRKHFPDHHIISEEGFGDHVSAESGVLWLVDPIDGTMNFVHQHRHFAISIGIYENGIGQVGLIYDVMADDLYHVVKGNGAFLNEHRIPMLEEGYLDKAVFGINATWVNENRRIDPEIMRPIVRKTRGTRSYGSAAIEIAYVTCGLLDAYFTMRLSPWDYGAGLVLLNEVGGVATHVDGKPLDLLAGGSVLVGKPGVHREIVQLIQEGLKNGKYLNEGPLK